MNYAKSQGCIWIIEPTPESSQQEGEELPMKAFHGIRDAQGICHLPPLCKRPVIVRLNAPVQTISVVTLASIV